jgi:hypothetical protein
VAGVTASAPGAAAGRCLTRRGFRATGGAAVVQAREVAKLRVSAQPAAAPARPLARVRGRRRRSDPRGPGRVLLDPGSGGGLSGQPRRRLVADRRRIDVAIVDLGLGADSGIDRSPRSGTSSTSWPTPCSTIATTCSSR